MSSLREDIKDCLVYYGATRAQLYLQTAGKPPYSSKTEALKAETLAQIMSAIESHIPEEQVGSWADERKDGFNEAVDLMREEMK